MLFPSIEGLAHGLQYAVDRQAASISGFDCLPIDRNHSEICKFSREEDDAWDIVGRHLKLMGANAKQKSIRCDHDSAQSRKSNTPSIGLLDGTLATASEVKLTLVLDWQELASVIARTMQACIVFID